jgi:hypothetical protein
VQQTVSAAIRWIRNEEANGMKEDERCRCSRQAPRLSQDIPLAIFLAFVDPRSPVDLRSVRSVHRADAMQSLGKLRMFCCIPESE